MKMYSKAIQVVMSTENENHRFDVLEEIAEKILHKSDLYGESYEMFIKPVENCLIVRRILTCTKCNTSEEVNYLCNVLTLDELNTIEDWKTLLDKFINLQVCCPATHSAIVSNAFPPQNCHLMPPFLYLHCGDIFSKKPPSSWLKEVLYNKYFVPHLLPKSVTNFYSF